MQTSRVEVENHSTAGPLYSKDRLDRAESKYKDAQTTSTITSPQTNTILGVFINLWTAFWFCFVKHFET